MKKKIAIISYSMLTGETYKEQIISLFLDNVNVDRFCIESEELKNGIEADLILIPSYNVFKIIQPYINKRSEIVIANRTISKSALEKIKAIPVGTKALLMDENIEMASQMVSVIYQLGARHVELTPVCPSSELDVKGEILIILGERNNICDVKGETINIGSSLLDISTIINIGAKLDLIHILQRQNIMKSYKEIVTTDVGLSRVIGQTNRFESEIDILMQVLDDGIIAVSAKGIITIYNDGAESIIGYKKQETIGKSGLDIMPYIPFKYALENLEPIKEKLIRLNGYDVVVSVDPIIHSNKLYGAVAIVKKFNDIEKKQHKLREQLIGKGHRSKYGFEDIQGESESIKRCIDIAKRMAKSDSSILITGESGTGKELFAHAIHNNSKRKNYQFVALNCGALPESLLESELFGYEEGAFTGARKGGKPGLFELAHNGTLFLDEIGEMPLNLQMRLLRVLQEREVMRIGGDSLINVNIRVICATNRNLKEMVKKGEFREDLYYRLRVLPLKIPPLRERKEDIPSLINKFKEQFSSDFELTMEAKEIFLNHNWKGNVRELKNYIEYFANLGLTQIDVVDLPFDNDEENSTNILSSNEKDLFEKFLVEAKDKTEKYIFILDEMEKSHVSKTRLGRRSLYKLAADKNIFLSEQEIRTMLINLERYSMVKVYTGRGGSIITDYGRRVLRYLNESYK